MEDYSALKSVLSTTSAAVLGDSARQTLAKLDRHIVLKSPKGFFRDFRGLAELMDFQCHDIRSLEREEHPTIKILESWENRPDATLDKLIEYLEHMDRYDVIQDLIPKLSFEIEIVPPIAWKADDPKYIIPILTPVKHIFIHHTVTPFCDTKYGCSAEMRQMQKYHMTKYEWGDIGYNFVIGSDGRVYEGVGWNAVGRHTYKWNDKSYGIAFIGDYTSAKPNSNMLRAAILLIDYGVKKGFISESHFVHGGRDARETSSPGDKLYAIIRKWPRYQGDLSLFANDVN